MTFAEIIVARLSLFMAPLYLFCHVMVCDDNALLLITAPARLVSEATLAQHMIGFEKYFADELLSDACCVFFVFSPPGMSDTHRYALVLISAAVCSSYVLDPAKSDRHPPPTEFIYGARLFF